VSTIRIIATLIAITLGASGCARASNGAGTPAPDKTLPVTTGDFPAYGHAPDFTWVAGRIVRSAPAGECTFVIFSTRKGQPWGGRIALTSSSGEVGRYPNGDMVVVSGVLDSRMPSACGVPTLSVKSIEEH
jgi:hypothetical protein